MSEWVIEPLGRQHERGGFSCGKAPLDKFLHALVSQYEKRNLGRTYVAVRPGESHVTGYYTLVSGAISFDHVPSEHAKKLPRHSVPAILLARLAVDESSRGQGFGRVLLINALRRCFELSKQIGVHAVEVDAIDDEARSFYERHGFLPLLDNPLHLFMPMTSVEKAFGDASDA